MWVSPSTPHKSAITPQQVLFFLLARSIFFQLISLLYSYKLTQLHSVSPGHLHLDTYSILSGRQRKSLFTLWLLSSWEPVTSYSSFLKQSYLTYLNDNFLWHTPHAQLGLTTGLCPFPPLLNVGGKTTDKQGSYHFPFPLTRLPQKLTSHITQLGFSITFSLLPIIKFVLMG